jgi:hypothetical protein
MLALATLVLFISPAGSVAAPSEDKEKEKIKNPTAANRRSLS